MVTVTVISDNEEEEEDDDDDIGRGVYFTTLHRLKVFL